MSVLSGAMTFQRLYLPNDEKFNEDYIKERLGLFRFRPLHAQGIDNESLGFCPYRSEFDNEKAIEVADFLFDQAIIFSVRLDVIKIPRPLLKALVKKSVIAYQREHGKKADRTVIKEIEKAESAGLRARILPKSTIVEIVWQKNTNEILVLNRSERLVERFIDIFYQSFLVRPLKKDFAFASLDCAKKERLSLSDALKPLSLAREVRDVRH